MYYGTKPRRIRKYRRLRQHPGKRRQDDEDVWHRPRSPRELPYYKNFCAAKFSTFVKKFNSTTDLANTPNVTESIGVHSIENFFVTGPTISFFFLFVLVGSPIIHVQRFTHTLKYTPFAAPCQDQVRTCVIVSVSRNKQNYSYQKFEIQRLFTN